MKDRGAADPDSGDLPQDEERAESASLDADAGGADDLTGAAANEADAPASEKPLSIVTALASSIVTGAGHWIIRRYRRALWFFLPAGILVVGGLLYAAVQGRTELAVKTVQMPWLWTFLALNVAFLAFRVVATTDAWKLGRRPTSRPWMGLVGLVLALAVTSAPHLIIASYNLTWIDTLQEVFDAPVVTTTTDPDVFAGPALSTTTTSAETTTTSTTEPRVVGVPDFDLPPITIPITEFLDIEDLAEGRYLSVLLAGGDAGPGRGGLRTDTMIVATLDLEANRAYLFGLSRELVHIPIPSGFRKAFYDLEDRLWEIELQDWIQDQDKRCRKNGEWKTNPPDFCPELIEQPEHCDCFPDRLNAIYTYTRHWTNTWPDVPDPGMEALRQSVERLLSIPIDYYALVDMAGFVSLVDALGGVDIWVYEAVHQGFSPAVEGGPIVRVDVDPGYYHLDGSQALAYVRDRSISGDSGRVRRQRCMVRSVAAAADPLDLIWNFPDIAAAIRDNTTTNIPLEFLPDLVRATANLSLDDIVTVSLTGSYYHDDSDWRDIPKPDLNHIRWRVQTVLEGTGEGSSEGEGNECGDPEEITSNELGE
jgi:LCP family protein required for cell wall assembly